MEGDGKINKAEDIFIRLSSHKWSIHDWSIQGALVGRWNAIPVLQKCNPGEGNSFSKKVDGFWFFLVKQTFQGQDMRLCTHDLLRHCGCPFPRSKFFYGLLVLRLWFCSLPGNREICASGLYYFMHFFCFYVVSGRGLGGCDKL